MVFSPNFPKFIEIINFGALLDHVIKYTQYFPNQSLTETLTRSNSTNFHIWYWLGHVTLKSREQRVNCINR